MDPVTQSSHLTGIALAAKGCIASFESCLSTKPLMKDGWAESRLADMNLWAAGVGALAVPAASLDRRLQFQPKVRLVLTSLLVTLQELVEYCRTCASNNTSAEALDPEDESKPIGSADNDTVRFGLADDADAAASSLSWFDSLDTGSVSDSDSSSNFDDEIDPNETKSEATLAKAMKDTEDILDQLLMLGYAIRKSGTAARLQRADNTFEPENHQNFRLQLESILRNAVQRKQWGHGGDERTTAEDRMKQAEDCGDVGGVTSQQQHLITANLRRRHRFQYARRHQQKLDHSTFRPPVPKAQPDEDNTKDQQTSISESRDKAGDEQQNTQDSQNSPATGTPDDTLEARGTSATAPSAVEGEIASIPLQAAASRVSVSVAKMHYPSPPPVSNQMRGFKCPCCYQTLPEMFQESSRWRKHLVEDLCPYTCPFVDCPSPEVLYISRPAWRSHVLEAHGAGQFWECLACAGTPTPNTFLSSEEFINHNRTKHKDAISEEQIVDLLESCRKMAPPNISQCPLCPWPQEDVVPDATANLEHVGNCIHEFSLNSLPWVETSLAMTADDLHVVAAVVEEWLSCTTDPINRAGIQKVDILSFRALPSPPSPITQAMAEIVEYGFVESSGGPSQGGRGSASFDSDLPEVRGTYSDDETESISSLPERTDRVEFKTRITRSLLKNIDGENFLPADEIHSLTRPELVATELDLQNLQPDPALLGFISGRGMRIFLTLAYCECLENLTSVFKSDFDDAKLPIQDPALSQRGPDSPISTTQDSQRGLGMTEPWDGFDNLQKQDQDSLFDSQWLFLAPVFTSEQFSYAFPSRQPLPYLSIEGTHEMLRPMERTRKVQIHPLHLSTLGEFKDTTMYLTTTTEVVRAALYDSLSHKIQELGNRHLVRAVATYQRESLICYLFPCGDGSNLNEYWYRKAKHQTTVAPSPEVVWWAVEQMAGLAEALNTLHQQGIRHGDVRPDNILVFEQNGGSDVLKISLIDFNSHNGTPPARLSNSAPINRRYEPPEMDMRMKSMAPRSRTSDVWSIGCIYLEFLTWLRHGTSGLEAFRGPGGVQRFWEMHGDSPDISAALKRWAEQSPFRIQPGFQNALKDILDIVFNRLLVVQTDAENTQSRQVRANSSEFSKLMSEIYQKAKNDVDYLYDPKIWVTKYRSMLDIQSEDNQTSTGSPSRPSSRDGFRIAIVCAFVAEYDAVACLVDEFWDDNGDGYARAAGDPNIYTTGRIGSHNVVLSLLPAFGKVSAASGIAIMRSSYPSLQLVLFVGICGGTPRNSQHDEILLGDVVISKDLIQVDFGRRYSSRFSNRPTGQISGNTKLRQLLTQIETKSGSDQLKRQTTHFLQRLQEVVAHSRRSKNKNKYNYPGAENDKLYEANYRHKHNASPTCICRDCLSNADPVCHEVFNSTCEELECDDEHLATRNRLGGQGPTIHIGTIASGDVVIKSGEDRDRISKETGAIAFEMEGCSVWDEMPTLIIKGVCDYSDGHRRKQWQQYAAATAASATKAILEMVPLLDAPEASLAVDFHDSDRRKGSPSVLQTVPAYRLRSEELLNFCREVFHDSEINLEFRDDTYILSLPRMLTEHELKSIRSMRK